MTQEELIADFVNRRVWAVVGASNDRRKFGNRVLRDLRSAGYRVYAVNPHAESVEGEPSYPNLAELPERPDVVDFVVPPAVGERVVEEAAALGLHRLWFQPGAESPRLRRRSRELGLEPVVDACAMVRKRRWPAEP